MATPSLKAPRPAEFQDATPPASSPNHAPIAVFRFEGVSAAVFTETITMGRGPVTVFNVSLRRSYQDAEDAWHHTHSLRGGDLLPAALALMKAYEFVEDARGKGAQAS